MLQDRLDAADRKHTLLKNPGGTNLSGSGGRTVEIAEGQRHTRERDDFCEECAEEHYDMEKEIDEERNYHRQGRTNQDPERLAG